jgi:hypothetical protein
MSNAECRTEVNGSFVRTLEFAARTWQRSPNGPSSRWREVESSHYQEPFHGRLFSFRDLAEEPGTGAGPLPINRAGRHSERRGGFGHRHAGEVAEVYDYRPGGEVSPSRFRLPLRFRRLAGFS